MKHAALLFLLLVGIPLAGLSDAQIPESNYQWWREARFGIFIHWNASSALQLGEGSWSRKNPTEQGHDYHKKGLNRMERQPPAAITDGSFRKFAGKGGVPMEVYDNLYHVFNPIEFNADQWARAFKDAGAGYVVLTTKHHDGFCMFDSQFTDYKITNTPFKRDVCKEMSDACHRHGLKVIWYYSKCDWFDPRHDVNNQGPYVEYLTNQIRELLTNYGEINGIWWDAGEIVIPTRPLFDMILKLQPRLISNGRIQSRNNPVPGVPFGTPKQFDTMSNRKYWFWRADMEMRPTAEVLVEMADVVSKNGNYLLNIPPAPDGTLTSGQEKLLIEIGRWLVVNGEAIYGTRPWKVFGEGPTEGLGPQFQGNPPKTPYTSQDIRFTTKGDVLYAIVLAWPDNGTVIIKTPGVEGRLVRLLGSAEPVKADGATFELSRQQRRAEPFVLKFE